MANAIGPDVSFYQDDNATPQGVNFVTMRQATEYVIIRAGQNLWEDQDFRRNWSAAKSAGLLRGSYWFYDSRADPIKQAQLWVDAMQGDYGELPLWADFEDKYDGFWKGPQHWREFMEEVKRLISTPHDLGIYTAYYYWKDYGPQDSISLAYFHQYPLWIANYGVSAPHVPLPWAADEWLFWQYQSNDMNTLGAQYGCESKGVDLNQFHGDSAALRAMFGGAAPAPTPPPPAIAYTHDGIACIRVTRFDALCVIHVIDLAKVRCFVSPGGKITVGAAVTKYGAQIGVNGGGWPNVQTEGHRSNEIWISDGTILQATALDDRPYINVSKQGVARIVKNDALIPERWNAWGFDRLLGYDGIYNDRISDNYTKDARTGSGITADGKLILLSAEGNDRYQKGLTFKEMWMVLQEFGAIHAGNNDGGSSSAVHNTALSPNSLIVPSDGAEATVINQVLFFASGEVPPIDPEPPDPPTGGSMNHYKMINPARPRSEPSVFTSDTAANVPAGYEFDSAHTQQDVNNASGPMMVQIETPGTYYLKWVPLGFYNGVEYARLISIGSTPPPAGARAFTLKVDGYKLFTGNLEPE